MNLTRRLSADCSRRKRIEEAAKMAVMTGALWRRLIIWKERSSVEAIDKIKELPV